MSHTCEIDKYRYKRPIDSCKTWKHGLPYRKDIRKSVCYYGNYHGWFDSFNRVTFSAKAIVYMSTSPHERATSKVKIEALQCFTWILTTVPSQIQIGELIRQISGDLHGSILRYEFSGLPWIQHEKAQDLLLQPPMERHSRRSLRWKREAFKQIWQPLIVPEEKACSLHEN